MPTRLRPVQVMAILSVLVISLAAVTGYYVWHPPWSADGARRGATAGGASMAMLSGDADSAYRMAVRDVWRTAMTGLERFRIAMATGDLQRIARAAGELRVEFDVLAIDVRYIEPPASRESMHRSLLRSIEQSAAMFERAEALASDPLDEDAVTSNAELLSAAAQQARAAYEGARAEAGRMGLGGSTSVWGHLDAIATLAREERMREAEGGGRPGSVRGWGAGTW